MNGSAQGLRGLVHSVSYPTSNQSYASDQQTLRDLYKEPEFFLALQELAADRTLSQPERLLASIISGRELKTKWRVKTLVPEARKPDARQRLFSFLEEEDFQIARPQLSLLVSVSRIELPRIFPNLPQLLLNPLLTSLSQLTASGTSSSTATVLLNTVWTINALVKEWRSVKIASGQEVMRMLEDTFAEPVGRMLGIWSERERNGLDDWVISEAGRYAFKILARFGQWHWSKAQNLQMPEGIQRIQGLVQHTAAHAPILHAHRLRVIYNADSPPAGADRAKLLHSLLKHLRATGKWWRTMIGIDPKRFCAMEGVTSGIGWWWGEVGGVVAGSDGAVANEDTDDVAYPKRFLLLGMLLFKDILPILSAEHPAIFTRDFVLSALHLLIDKLLPLTSTDLEGLEDEPEEWLISESVDEEAWQFEFRPCAERVLMALNNACRSFPAEQKVMEPEMLKVFHQAETLPPDDLRAILRREAVYCALGRLSRSLSTYGGLDFNAFLTHTSSWLTQGIPLHRILKRRLAWLIGQWVSSDEECAKLPIVWQTLIHLIAERGEASDMAVRLSSAIAIKECVDLWELEIVYFEPYLEQTVTQLINLMGEASTLGGKRYLNETISVVIERVEGKIMPYLPTLAQAIPGLWHGAGGLEGEWLFKASLVTLMTNIVKAAKGSSGNLMELVIPLIEESLQSPAKDFFEEDGIDLWQAGMYNCTSLYQPTRETGLIRLLPGLTVGLESNFDLMMSFLKLLDSYILLDAPGILQLHGAAICTALQTGLTWAKRNVDNSKRLLSTLALLVRTAPIAILAPLLITSGLFTFTLHALEDDKAAGLVLAAHLEVLARLAMSDPAVFLQMVAEIARMENRDGHKTLEETLDAMWRNFDYVADARSRKAIAMAAGSLLTTQCLERLDGEFMNIFLDVLGEVQASQEDGGGTEPSVRSWKDEHSTEWAEIDGTSEGARRLQVEDTDPAFAIPIKAYIIDCLQRTQAVGLGPYWEKADAGARKSLEKFLA